MAYTQTQVEQQVMVLLNEANNSVLAALQAGGGGADTVSHQAVLDRFIDEAIADLAMSVWPIPGKGTKASYVIGQRTIGYHDLTGQMDRSAASDSSRLWFASDVYYNSVRLEYVDLEVLRSEKPDYASPTPGTPSYWYPEGDYGVGLYTTPSASQTLVAYGYSVPPSITTGGAAHIGWLPDDRARLVTLHAAIRIVLKNLEDPQLTMRGQAYLQELNELLEGHWLRLPTEWRRNIFKQAPKVQVPTPKPKVA
jgi:hypothetical protein